MLEASPDATLRLAPIGRRSALFPSGEDAGTEVPVRRRRGPRFHLEPTEAQYRAGADTACGRSRVPSWRCVDRPEQVPSSGHLCGRCGQLWESQRAPR